MAGPTPFESEAAHLRALQLFSRYFLGRFPDGEVISELQYMAATTAAYGSFHALHFAGKPKINKIMDALATDFRRWLKARDFRKSDGMGITIDGLDAELIEVTTVGRNQAAQTQLRDKLDTLNRTVNKIHNLSTDWKAAKWRPVGLDLFYPLPPLGGQIRVLSFHPTYRENAPDGIILYEILERGPVPVPVAIPQEDALKGKARSAQRQGTRAWATAFASAHPLIIAALRALALLVGVAAAAAAIVLIFDPVPGDEVAAAAAAVALVTFARTGSVGPEFDG